MVAVTEAGPAFNYCRGRKRLGPQRQMLYILFLLLGLGVVMYLIGVM